MDIRLLLAPLHGAYPQARYELNFETPLQLLIATVLAAQCTDERVNRVTATLFPKYPDAHAYAAADLAVLEEDVKPTGFFRQKARTLQALCQVLCERHGGQVPAQMAALIELPGVARKTANVVLNTAFGVASGIIVDTHVVRVSQRLGLTQEDKAERIEQDLMRLVPQGEWIHFGAALVLHGRYTCTARNPQCGSCPLAELCPRVGV